MTFPFAILDGRRHFAWRPVRLEDGRPAWLRFVFRLNPVAGIVPTFQSREVAFTDRIPHCAPGILGWLRAGVLGKAFAMRVRLLGYGVLWLLAVWLVTGATGWLFAWPAAFGGVRVGDVAVYAPGQFLGWRPLLRPEHRWIIDAASVVCLLATAAVVVRVALDLRGRVRPLGFGSGRWARRADVRRSNLL